MKKTRTVSIDAAGRARAVALAALLWVLDPAGGRAAPAAAGTPPDLTGLSLEQLLAIDVVYGASKYEQKIGAAPASVSVITADDIQRYGYITLAEILDAMRGVYTTYDRDYSFVGVRGFQRPSDYNLRTLLLIDGHRINDSIYNTALIGTEGVVNVDDIERVEFIRGPSSSIYGAGAFFAVINVVTKRGADHKGIELSGHLGSYDTESGRLAYGAKTDAGTDLFVSGSGYQSGGQDLFYKEFDTPADNNGLAENVDTDRNIKGLARVTFGHFTLEAAHSRREKLIPTAPYGTVFNSPENRTLDERSYLDFKYARPLSERSEILARVYGDRYHYSGRFFYTAPYNLYIEHAHAFTRGLELQYTVRPGDHNTLVTGGEYRDHYREDFFADDDSLVYLDAHRTDSDWGVFLQDDLAAAKRVALSLGARYDHYMSFGGTLNPRFGLILSPVPRMAVKLLAGRAFRAPSIFELYYGNGANPNLDPETIRTGEIILEYETQGSLRFTGGLFRNSISNLISLGTAPTLFLNIDGIVSEGLEMEMERPWSNGVRLNASYAYQDTTQADGTRFSNSPRHIAKLRLNTPLFGSRLSLGTELHYTGPRTTLGGDEVGGFTLANLTFLSRGLAHGLDLSGSVYNLFDKRYADPAASVSATLQDAIEQNGRSYRIKLTWRF